MRKLILALNAVWLIFAVNSSYAADLFIRMSVKNETDENFFMCTNDYYSLKHVHVFRKNIYPKGEVFIETQQDDFPLAGYIHLFSNSNKNFTGNSKYITSFAFALTFGWSFEECRTDIKYAFKKIIVDNNEWTFEPLEVKAAQVATMIASNNHIETGYKIKVESHAHHKGWHPGPVPSNDNHKIKEEEFTGGEYIITISKTK